MRTFFSGAVVAGLAVVAVAGCGSSSTSGGTVASPARTVPGTHTVNAAAPAAVLTRRKLLARVDRLCARESATVAPLLRQLNRRGIRPNAGELIAGLMAAARSLEFGLTRLRPSPGDAEAFRRYRNSVMRFNALDEQIAAAQSANHQPSREIIDAADDDAILEQADAAALGAHGCTFPSTRLVIRRRSS